MISDLVIYAVFAVFLIVLFAIIYVRDASITRKLSAYEKILDSLIKENYKIKKSIETSESPFSMDELARKIDIRINDALSSKVIPMIESLKNLETSIDEFQSEQQDRIYNLEERTKNISRLAPRGSESEQIQLLFKNGKTPEEIARDLHISVGRVEMILKFSKADLSAD